MKILCVWIVYFNSSETPTYLPSTWAGNLFERRYKINPADVSLSTTGLSPVKGDDNRTAPDVNSTLACESVPATARALAMDLYIHETCTVHAFAVQPVVLGLPRRYRMCFSHGPVCVYTVYALAVQPVVLGLWRRYRTCFSHGPAHIHVYNLRFSCATCGFGPAA